MKLKTANKWQFQCSQCGKMHEGGPSFSFDAPLYYGKEHPNAELTSDTCVIGDHHFLRVCLEIPIHGKDEPFLWGVWVSISRANFRRYVESADDPDTNDEYFGWFSNQLPFYPPTANLKTLIHPRSGKLRPWLELEPTDHPLTLDYRDGIDEARAQTIVECAMHQSEGK